MARYYQGLSHSLIGISLSFLLMGLASPHQTGATTTLPALKAERWVNSAPLTPAALKGKVVLIDVWEYTCVNWIRTSPYVKAWHRDYASLGLVVIGVHAPEFDVEKQGTNIDRGIRDHGLTYPIAIDNDFTIWRALGNDAWPVKFLFDAQGKLVNRWVGEGHYNEIEAEIRRQLIAAKPGATLPPPTPEGTSFGTIGQPSYAGITGETYIDGEHRRPGTVVLEGDWQASRQYVELRKGKGTITITFTGGEANLVMQPGQKGTAAVTVLLDGKPIDSGRGKDVGADGVARFDRFGMIRLVSGAARQQHVLMLVSSDPGLRAFVFTFGP